MQHIRKFSKTTLALGAALYLFSCREMQPESPVESAQKPPIDQIAPELAYPGEKGKIKKGVLRGTEITYAEIDGKAVFEGDIILSPEQLEHTGNARTDALTKLTSLWSNNTIPYTIDASVKDKQVILAAMAEIESKTQLRFRDKNNRSNPFPISPLIRVNYVTFQVGRGYASSVGPVGGQQFVTLPPWGTKGGVLHELAHTIGMYHEHTRPDRNSYVKINANNMDPADMQNVGKFSDNTHDPLPYRKFDFTSIMMLDSWAYSNNGQPVMTTMDNKTFTVQRDHLSPTDVDAIIAMYSNVLIGKEDNIYLGDSTTGRTVENAGYLPGYKKMFATSEYLYVADKSYLFEMNKKSGTGGYPIWVIPQGTSAIKAFTYANKNLYALQNGYLLRFAFPWGGGNPEKLGGQLWQGASAITYASGNLFIISGDVLYRVSLTGTSSSPIGYGYQGTTELVTLKDKVYALRPSGKLYRIDLVSGTPVLHTNTSYATNAQLASNGKNLLITSGNSLLNVSESGVVKVLSDGWAGATDLAVVNPDVK
ncbi:M12 family metallopeptidase [Dyadobacter luticola]|uniref:Peptidase M12A domain-containing protein n=1 Tax=Dyadobacter luticola TaxID=1979387 RepID=A0A5R9L555_9BACT|nr:M12 family metallopeptidase [Dyadobacter luticola]TLV03703.1 hypothetical protein FEN17_08920 [Dyadobacter luticola]